MRRLTPLALFLTTVAAVTGGVFVSSQSKVAVQAAVLVQTDSLRAETYRKNGLAPRKTVIRRLASRIDSILLAWKPETVYVRDSVPVPPVDTTTQPDTTPTPPDTTPKVSPVDTTTPPVDTTTAPPLPADTAIAMAELPRSVPAYPIGLASLCTAQPATTTALQTAINAARGGDVICLTRGAQYRTAGLVVPARTDAGWITLRTDGALPVGRVTPTTAAPLAKVVGTGFGGMTPLKFVARSARWLVRGVEIMADPALATGPTALVEVGTGQETTLADLPTDIVFEQVYAHGHATQHIRRAFALNGGAQTVKDSWCGEIHATGFDSQCVISWNGSGPFLIENNHLEAASENIMWGGADPRIVNLIPSDVTIRRNHIYKPAVWRVGKWNVKNLIETKAVARMLVEHNVMDGAWTDGQTGEAFVLKTNNPSGGCTWCVAEDITVRRNLIRNVGSFGTVAGNTFSQPALDSRRFLIEENYIESLNVAPYKGGGWFLVIVAKPRDVLVRNNTVAQSNTPNAMITIDGAARPTNVAIDNNAMPLGTYGIFAGGVGEGAKALTLISGIARADFNGWRSAFRNGYPPTSKWYADIPTALAAGHGVQRSVIDAATVGVVVQP
jgi:hypothetical protein